MGVAPFNIASSVILITAQRLARKLCPQCKRPADIPPEALLRAGFQEEDLDGSVAAVRPVGCDHCKGTGYKGRVGIYEVMPISDDMRQLIMRNGNAIDIAEQAQTRRRAQPAPIRPDQGQIRRHVARGNRGRHQRVSAQHRSARIEATPWPPQSPRADNRRQGIHVPLGRRRPQQQADARRDARARPKTVVTTNLRRQGIRVIKIKRQTFRGGRSITEKDITFFTRQLATMLQGRRAAAAVVRHRRARATATRASRG